MGGSWAKWVSSYPVFLGPGAILEALGGTKRARKSRRKVQKIGARFFIDFRTSFFIDFYQFLRSKMHPESTRNTEESGNGKFVKIVVSLKRNTDFRGSEAPKID